MYTRLRKLNFPAKRCCHRFAPLTKSSLLWTDQGVDSQSFRMPCTIDIKPVAWMASTMPSSSWVHWRLRYTVCIQWFRFQCHWDQLGWWLDRSHLDWELASRLILQCSLINRHPFIVFDQCYPRPYGLIHILQWFCQAESHVTIEFSLVNQESEWDQLLIFDKKLGFRLVW